MKRISLLMLTLFISLTCKNYQKTKRSENSQSEENITSHQEQNVTPPQPETDFDVIKKTEGEIARRNKKIADNEEAFRNFMSKCVRVLEKRRSYDDCVFIDITGKKLNNYGCGWTIIDPTYVDGCKQLFREAIEKDRSFATQEVSDHSKFIRKYTNQSTRYVEDREDYIMTLHLDYLIEEYHKNSNDLLLNQIFLTMEKNQYIKKAIDKFFILLDLMVTEQPQKYADFLVNNHPEFIFHRSPRRCNIITRYKVVLKQGDDTKIKSYEKFILLICKKTKVYLYDHGGAFKKLPFIEALIEQKLISITEEYYNKKRSIRFAS